MATLLSIFGSTSIGVPDNYATNITPYSGYTIENTYSDSGYDHFGCSEFV